MSTRASDNELRLFWKDSMEDSCNALILPANNKKKRRANKDQRLPKSKVPRLSKNEQRKLRRLQEEKEKKEKVAEALETLEKYKLTEDAYALLYASGTRGQKESMREKLRRAIYYERAGLKVPDEVPLLREKDTIGAYEHAHHTSIQEQVPEKSIAVNEIGVMSPPRQVFSDHTNDSTKARDDGCSYEGKSIVSTSLPSRQVKKSHEELGACNANNTKVKLFALERKKHHKKGKQVADNTDADIKEEKVPPCKVEDMITMNCDTGNVKEDIRGSNAKFVVHVVRSEEVRKAREKLPIIMMEQEIMEAISENPVTIICGETGCGKTTQVPQFLYEAGFSSSAYVERSGMIGVTQPRRVAVLATAKRLSYEMNVCLGQEVGFQVRHDRKVGSSTRIKFMTDGILLRELQSDFLLSKYSVIVLDEAHERSLNTDILIGMLSRVLPLRQKIYEEQCRAGDASVYPLKIVIMSATLLVDEFISNRRLFASPPPVIEVPARQFPVIVHFSAKTEIVDYVGKAYKKVCAIHKKLPPGGVLVFVTGQAEVHYLCKRLQRAFPKKKSRKMSENQTNAGNTDLKDISEAADGIVAEDEFYDELEMVESLEMGESVFESDSESDLEFSETEGMTVEKPESVCNLEWTAADSVCLESIKGAFDALTPSEKRVASEKPTNEKQDSIRNIGPLYVLPLYALLPAASQLKIFGAVPEGSRLVVVATNVAETSITIPGIRYVVDCGRVKEKVFENGSGISRYEVGWISKASAAQRAGRSGRTGPGHCYRLYSSALFNDTFPDFPQPEIYRAPIEGLVLLLKSMNIVKVTHFPFLSEPDKSALVEAEKCLCALSALDSNTGLLTPIGKAIALYPISPRHSRMLLTAMQIGCSNDIKQTCILLAYAGATVAALSLDSPFMTDIALPEDERGEHVERSVQYLHSADTDVKVVQNKTDAELDGKRVNATSGKIQGVTELEKSTRRQSSQNLRYRHPLSDALGVVKALRVYEMSNDPEDFCRKNNMHARILYEMSKLRKQLIHIYLAFSEDKGVSGISFCDGLSVADVEAVWKAENENHGFSVKHETVLRQAICAGWADRVACKVKIMEMMKSDGVVGKRKGRQYQICTTEEEVYIHPSSSLRKHAPDYVVFNELVRTSRPYMKVLTNVDADWLVTHANALCTFSKPLSDPPPWYNSIADDIYCWVSPSFGPHLWKLPLHKCPLKSKKHRIAVFAYAFLQGKVLPGMKMLNQHLVADPSILVIPAGKFQKRVAELLHALEVASIDSRHKLKSIWEIQSHFLFQEILLWMQKSCESHLESLWAVLKEEAQLDGRTLFGKKERKQVV